MERRIDSMVLQVYVLALKRNEPPKEWRLVS